MEMGWTQAQLEQENTAVFVELITQYAKLKAERRKVQGKH